MNVESIKLELMELLLKTQEEKVLRQLKAVFEENIHEVENQKNMIESAQRANKDIKSGLVHTPEEVEELLEKRFGK